MTNLTIGNYVGGKRYNGMACANTPDDRITVASLLSGIPASQGGADALSIDVSMDNGKIEDELLRAIIRFQTVQKKAGMKLVDGVVKPGGETMKFLNRLCIQPVPPAESHRLTVVKGRFQIQALFELPWSWEAPGENDPDNRSIFGGFTCTILAGQSGVQLKAAESPVRWQPSGLSVLDRPMLLQLAVAEREILAPKYMDVKKFASRTYEATVKIRGRALHTVELFIYLDGNDAVYFRDEEPQSKLVPYRLPSQRGPLEFDPAYNPYLGVGEITWKGVLSRIAEF